MCIPILWAKDIETVSLASLGDLMSDCPSKTLMIGAANAVVESVAKIVAMGGDYTKISS